MMPDRTMPDSTVCDGLPAQTGWELHNLDFVEHAALVADRSVDLVVADPPYRLGKDYGNGSDRRSEDEFLEWTRNWILCALPKLKPTGSLYLFATWRHAPEIFSFVKQHMTMVNEIIWDRRVPSMGGSTRRFSSVHDTIGLFALTSGYYFDIDAVRIPYDAVTRKARSRRRFEGSRWLEKGYNPKDVWSVSRLHRQHREREDHPTQKPLEIIERMVRASCPEDRLVLDPFAGSGTTLDACIRNRRRCVAFELNGEYCRIIRARAGRATSTAG